jgi:hypothetical protein
MRFTFLDWVGPLEMTAAELARVPAGIPGVYLLHVVAQARGGYVTFYAGKSLDLRRRLLQHLSARGTKPAIRAAREIDRALWSAAPVLDLLSISSIEAGLIRALLPICNTQLPVVAPTFVNLPPISLVSALQEEANHD